MTVTDETVTDEAIDGTDRAIASVIAVAFASASSRVEVSTVPSVVTSALAVRAVSDDETREAL